MNRRNVVIKAVLALILVWLSVWAVRSYAGSRKVTAERLNQQIQKARFVDWSKLDTIPNAAEAKRRETELRDIASTLNGLDFQEREKNRSNRGTEVFFRKLNQNEKNLFIELTIMESMNRFMESLDSMPAEQRKSFVAQGLKEVQEGRTADDMERANELGNDVLEKISQEGIRAYFEKSSTDTKLDLAPLMEAINETMQGLRGNEFGPRRPQ